GCYYYLNGIDDQREDNDPDPQRESFREESLKSRELTTRLDLPDEAMQAAGEGAEKGDGRGPGELDDLEATGAGILLVEKPRGWAAGLNLQAALGRIGNARGQEQEQATGEDGHQERLDRGHRGTICNRPQLVPDSREESDRRHPETASGRPQFVHHLLEDRPRGQACGIAGRARGPPERSRRTEIVCGEAAPVPGWTRQ